MTNATTAAFDFQSPNANPVTFRCSLDGAAAADCTSPKVYTGLNPGDRRFEVTAVNSAGTPDPDSAVHNWTIDTTDPKQRWAPPPPASTTSGFATFTFSSEAGAGFEVEAHRSAWAACSSRRSTESWRSAG